MISPPLLKRISGKSLYVQEVNLVELIYHQLTQPKLLTSKNTVSKPPKTLPDFLDQCPFVGGEAALLLPAVPSLLITVQNSGKW